MSVREEAQPDPEALCYSAFRCHVGQECYAEPAGKLFASILNMWVGKAPKDRPSILAVSIESRRTLLVTSNGPLAEEYVERIKAACAEYQTALAAIGEAYRVTQAPSTPAG